MYVFKFGKHSSKPFSQVMDEDPSYLVWLHEQDWIDTDLRVEIDKNFNEIEENYNWYLIDRDCPLCGTPGQIGCSCHYDILNY